MATRIGIRELRDGLTRILRRVENGEIVEVTRDDVPIAVLAPVTGSVLDAMIATGEAIPATPLATPIRPGPARGPMSASEALQADREE